MHPHEVGEVNRAVITHYVDGVDIPSRFDILERFAVIMSTDVREIDASRADGYFTLMENNLQVGVWFFTIIDGLLGSQRSHLANWEAMFRDLHAQLQPYMHTDVQLGRCVIRTGCAPHLVKPEDKMGAITLF
jgi:hypothetical protein